jgi:putative tryptophan/tyrosine transport system permease protein
MSLFAVASALSVGLLLGLLGLGVYLSFRILQYPDLTVEGSFALGASVAVTAIQFGVTPVLATIAGVFAGAAAGYVTALLSTRLRVHPVVAGILVSTACFSVCLAVMGAPNLSVSGDVTVFAIVEHWQTALSSDARLFLHPLAILIVLLIVKVALDVYLRSEAGMALRAAGSNPTMASGQAVDPGRATRGGLALANGLVGLSGALFAQSEHFADVNIGFGMLVVGLASVFIGEAMESRVFRSNAIAVATTAVIVGALVHRFSIAGVYELGLPTAYFNLFTSLLVLAALLAPGARERLGAMLRRATWP